MILYHISTMYQLLYVITHRLTVNKEKDCCLYIVEFIQPKEQLEILKKQLEDTGWFSFIKIIPEAVLKLSRGYALDEKSEAETIDTVINNISTAFEKWLDYDIKSCEKRYVASDQWSMGVYLLNHRIPYVYIEDASGMLSQQERYLQITKHFNKTNFIISNRLNGAGRSSIVQEKLCDLQNQQPDFHDAKATDFSIYAAMSQMPQELRQQVLSFYHAKTIAVNTKKPVCLFLTQYLQTMAKKDLDVQEQISTLLVDYIAANHDIIVKPHPKDNWLDYRRVFENACILPRNINAELLPFLFDIAPDMALTASSTSIGGLKPVVKESFSFGTSIETKWEHLHLYFALVCVLRCLLFDGEITYQGANRQQIEPFLDAYAVRLHISDESLLIDSGVCAAKEDTLQAFDYAVFLNTDAYTNGVTKEKFRDMVRVCCRVRPKTGSLIQPQYFSLFVFCRDPKKRERLQQLTVTRPLQYTKAQVQITGQSIDDQSAQQLFLKYDYQKRSYLHAIQNSGFRARETQQSAVAR